ncbi:MAG: hypothetical protein ACFFB0_16660 [Promethearchaeota archaeon]
MTLFDIISELFSNPTLIRYIIGGIILIVVIIVCYAIHNKLVNE